MSTITNIPTVTQDSARSLTGLSTKVTVTSSGQGILSNVLTPLDDPISGIIDMANTTIDLSVWFASAAQIQGSSLAMYLLSQDGATITLNVPRIIPDQWQSIHFDMPTTIQSGRYQLGILYNGTVTTTFWVDAISVLERVISWGARANDTDPWVPFHDVINSDTSGVVINRGVRLEVKGEAHRQNAAIMSSPKITPQYAHLGKALWPEDLQAFSNVYTTVLANTSNALTVGVPVTSIPISSFTNTTILNAYYNAGYNQITIYNGPLQQTVTLTGTLSYGAVAIPINSLTPTTTYPVGANIMILGAPWTYSLISGRNYRFTNGMATSFIISSEWAFGDGSIVNGNTVNHQFPTTAAANTNYNITLINTDMYGGRSALTQTITVP